MSIEGGVFNRLSIAWPGDKPFIASNEVGSTRYVNNPHRGIVRVAVGVWPT